MVCLPSPPSLLPPLACSLTPIHAPTPRFGGENLFEVVNVILQSAGAGTFLGEYAANYSYNNGPSTPRSILSCSVQLKYTLA